ncbi:hypothetical protein KXW10_000400 [Aspergillus fumigatus]|nr:hypothetical protein KXW10_000400 [Aspergillus fumigatus]
MANGIEVTVSVETVVVVGEGYAAWEATHVNDHLALTWRASHGQSYKPGKSTLHLADAKELELHVRKQKKRLC